MTCPGDLDPGIRRDAEAHLVAQATHVTPRDLRVLGRRVLEVVAPGVAEDHERRVLDREEALARRQTSLSFRRRGDGTTQIHARVSEAAAGRLKTYLEAWTAPRRAHHDQPENGSPAEWVDPESGRPVAQSVRYGRAFRHGNTDLDDSALLCPWHHHRAHDPAYATDRMPTGDLRFHRRQ